MLRLCSVAVSQSDGKIAVINSRMFTLITGVFFCTDAKGMFSGVSEESAKMKRRSFGVKPEKGLYLPHLFFLFLFHFEKKFPVKRNATMINDATLTMK